MFRKSIGAFLAVVSIGFQPNRKFSVSALKLSSTLGRTVHSGLFTLIVSGRSLSTYSSTMSYSNYGEGLHKSNLKEFRDEDVSFINSTMAKSIDDDLMFNDGSFSLDQLMELAGLSVASAAHDLYCRKYSDGARTVDSRKILIISGPGNNGGDGLVAARHLKHFGYNPVVVYPKKSTGAIFKNLVRQLDDLGIEVRSDIPADVEVATNGNIDASSASENTMQSYTAYLSNFDLIVDSIFGFSFEGSPRAPFNSIIAALAKTSVPVISVDVPSGWHIEQGDLHSSGLKPVSVVSLTAPKLCMQGYEGVHYIGGRFMPPALAKKYQLKMPDYGFGTNQIVVSAPKHGNQELVSDTSSTIMGLDESELSAVFVTASSLDEAKKLSSGLLTRGLVACVNLVPQVTSMFIWEGVMEESSEVIMMIKTRTSLLPSVTAYVKSAHSYTTPEVLALPVQGGSAEYLNWVRSETKRSTAAEGAQGETAVRDSAL